MLKDFAATARRVAARCVAPRNVRRILLTSPLITYAWPAIMIAARISIERATPCRSSSNRYVIFFHTRNGRAPTGEEVAATFARERARAFRARDALLGR